MNERTLKGFLFKAIGLVMAVVAVGGVAVADKQTSFLVVLGWIALAVCGGLVALRGQRISQPLAEELLQADKRPPIIYLRSFEDEVAESRLGRLLTGGFGRAIPGVSSAWGPREQVEFASYVARVGPYIAIGRPGEPLPELGAARLYVPDNRWRKVVGDYLRDATAVILRAGRSEGLRWEIEQLVRNQSPKKVLLILPKSKRDYATFRDWSSRVLPKKLPEDMPKSRLLMFGEDWRPLPLKAGDTLFQTLWPFFDQNNIPFPKNQFQAMER